VRGGGEWRATHSLAFQGEGTGVVCKVLEACVC
jgi:hypothetical protein